MLRFVREAARRWRGWRAGANKVGGEEDKASGAVEIFFLSAREIEALKRQSGLDEERPG